MIRLKDVEMEYENGTAAIRGISLDIQDGEFVFLVGPSGSGKSTLIKLLTGEVVPSSGRIMVNGFAVSSITPRILPLMRRTLGIIFQDFRLIPKKTVYDNLDFVMRAVGAPNKEIRQRIPYVLDLVGLKKKADYYPTELSGGEQQRVAIARALVNRPKVLLLDEPLAALDLKLRKDMQIELKRIQQQVGITFIYVTHDQEEALSMSDTIVIMDKGTIQQIGTPEDIYNEPKNAFVADFIGESNIIDGTMPRDNVVKMYGREFPCLDGGFAPNEPVDVVIRPEDIDIVPVEQGQLTGTVTSVTFKGMQYDIIVDFKGFKWLIQTTDHSPKDARIGIKLDPDSIHVMKKSRYSGMFGDYSSFSEEYDELDDASLGLDEEESGDEE